MKSVKKYLLVGIVAVVGGLALYYVISFAVYIYTSMKIINEEVARRSDYTKITSPLSAQVASDICAKFMISTADRRCQAGAVVYGPDFFKDIVGYFNNVQRGDLTYQVVQAKLGAYLISCDAPDRIGRYECRYDLRGDRMYLMGFFFTKDGRLYSIHADIGGS